MINFKYPIEYQSETKEINETIKTDLELVETNDKNIKSIYQHYIQPKTKLGEKCLEDMSNYYTTDKDYLKDTQNVIENIDNIKYDSQILTKTYENWKKVKNEQYFIEKYQYIGWSKLIWLNYSKIFLHFLSIYNIFSPIINLLSPLVIFIVPFVMLKFLRAKITWPMYKKILLMQMRNHAIGQLFTSFGSVSTNKKLYILFCAGMYIYNLYQNVLSCIRYYKNSFFILENIDQLKHYLRYTIKKMKTFNENVKDIPKYAKFLSDMNFERENLEYFLNEIKNIPKKTLSLSNLLHLGKTMRCFYKIYDHIDLNKTMEYSFSFNGYIECLLGIKENINNKVIHKIKYKNKDNCCKMKKIYHPSIDKPVKNNIDLKNNKIITGPNASGKTTLLKTLLINVILSQQYGFGYYDSGTLNPYQHIHCYLNIPDTSGEIVYFKQKLDVVKRL